MTLNDLIFWLIVAAATAPVWATILWETWRGFVRPRFISRTEIDRLTADMLAKYGDDAEEMASIEEDRAWRYSDSFERGKWRRVRKRLSRSLG